MSLGSKVLFKTQKLKSELEDTARNSGLLKDAFSKDVRPVFIISTGRTGTHFLTHFFNNNIPNTLAVHEPPVDVFDLNIAVARGDVSLHRARMMFRSFRKKLINKSAQNNLMYLESNNNLSYLIPVLRREFRKYKIIYIKRAGKDYVRSSYSKFTYGKWVGKVPVMSEKDPRDRIKATFFEDDPYHDKWSRMSRFEKICWNWKTIDRNIFKETKNDPNAISFKFEDLFLKKDVSKWMKMFEFAEVEEKPDPDNILDYIDGKKSNQSQEYLLPEWEEWPDEYKKKFIRIAGDHMEEIGYPIS